MTLRDLGTCPALTCTPAAGVVEAARLMTEGNVGFLPVVDDRGRPVGVVTDRDIVVRAVASGRAGEATVQDVMTAHPECVGDTTTPTDAARVMADRGCRRVVLTDDADHVIGVVSLDDLLRVAGDELAQMTRVARSARPAHDVL